MQRPTHFSIDIPSPCHEQWDNMAAVTGGRLCDSCRKTVVDFTDFTDQQLQQYICNAKTEVCGRFRNTQLNRMITIPPQPKSYLYKLFITGGLILLFTAPVYSQQGPVVPIPHISVDSSHQQSKTTGSTDTGSISGIIVDDNKQPMINAAVELFQNKKQVGGFITDYNGAFEINNIVPGTYTLLILDASGDSLIKQINIEPGLNVLSQIDFRPSKQILEAKIIMGGIHTERIAFPIDEENPSKRTFRRDDINHMPLR